jgi:hypothetical protein
MQGAFISTRFISIIAIYLMSSSSSPQFIQLMNVGIGALRALCGIQIQACHRLMGHFAGNLI